MKLFKTLIASLSFFSLQAFAATIPAVTDGPTPIPFSDLSTNNRYQISVTRAVTPKKMTGNPFRDSYLQARCGDQILATDSRRIAPSDFGKVLNFSVQFEISTDICSSLDIVVELQVNGITIDSPTIQYSHVEDGETATAYISRIRGGIETHQLDLVYYHGELSKAAGNRKSLHCVIHDYESDAIYDQIISDLKISYQKLFGVPYVSADFDCTEKSPLDSEIASCTSGSPRRPFCAFYTLYSQVLGWFDQGISDGRKQKARLRQGDIAKSQELDAVTAELENAKNQSLSQITGVGT